VVVTPPPVPKTCCLLPTQRGKTLPTPPPPHPRCRNCTPHCASPFQSIPVLFLAKQSPAITAGLLWSSRHPQCPKHAACCPHNAERPPPLHRRHTPVTGTAHLTVLHHFNRSPLCFLLSSRLPSPRGCCGRHAIPSAQNMLPAAHTTRNDPPHSTTATPPFSALHTSLCFTISIDPRCVSC